MLAYHNKKEIKEYYLARVRAHRAADELVQGYGYWEGGKGCAVGCTIHGRDYGAYETELGIPRALARVEDYLFEHLPVEQARGWPERFLAAINPGADLSLVGSRWLLWLLSDVEHGTLRLCDPKGAEVTKRIIALYQRKISGGKISVGGCWGVRRDAAAAAANAAAADANAAADAAAAAAAYAAADAAADANAAYAADAADAADAYAAAAAAAKRRGLTPPELLAIRVPYWEAAARCLERMCQVTS